jgi:Uma2 family endonuclease
VSLLEGRELRTLSREDFMRLAEAGILADDERVELIDGQLVAVSPEDPEHGSLVRRLTTLLAARYAPLGGEVGSSTTLDAGEGQLPLPDVLVLRRPVGGRHPVGADALMVVEVSRSSLAFDTSIKARIYAAAGVPLYVVVNVAARELVVHADPGSEAYQAIRRLGFEQELDLPAGAGSLRVADLFAGA